MSENPFLQRMKLNALDIGGEVEAPKQEEKQDEKKFEIPQEVVTAGIPLLVGALMGKPSIGAKVGAKTIAEGLDRQYQIEKEQRKKIASGDDKLYSYIDPLTYFSETPRIVLMASCISATISGLGLPVFSSNILF